MKRIGQAESRRARVLQQTLGNQAVLRVLSANTAPKSIQAKLAVGSIDDPLEREADSVADRVVRMREPATPTLGGEAPVMIRRVCRQCDEEPERVSESSVVRRAVDRSGMGGNVAGSDGMASIDLASLTGGGRAMSHEARAFFEPRFGRDFSPVRIHDDVAAHQAARAINARAFTVGPDIFFGENEFDPGTTAGRSLLAHELTHTLQQGLAGKGSAPDEVMGGTAAADIARPLEQAAEVNGAANVATYDSPLSVDRIGVSRAQPRVQRAALTPGATSVIPVPQSQRGKGIFAKAGTMEGLVEQWHRAGLLDAPFRPDDVPPISPVPHPGSYPDILAEIDDEAGGADAANSMAGLGLQPVPGSRPPPPIVFQPPPSQPVPAPRLPPVEPVPNLPTPTPGRGPGFRPTPRLGPPILVLGSLLIPIVAPKIARWVLRQQYPELDWEGKTNPITKQPFEGLEEYSWLNELSAEQLEYLSLLFEARSLTRDPSVDVQDQLATPDAAALAAISAEVEVDEQLEVSQGKPRKRRCRHGHVRRNFYDLRHDEYAMNVSHDPHNLDYHVGFGVLMPYSMAFDAITHGGRFLWEVKTGYGFLFNGTYPALAGLTRWERQKDIGLFVATVCDFDLIWSIGPRDRNNRADVNTARLLAQAMNRVWHGRPPVFSLPG